MRTRADVAIIGGGVIGCSIALHVRELMPKARVVVLERDNSYARASSRLATGGIRQQYASALNVQLARHSVRFYETMDERLRNAGLATRIWFRQRGYLFLSDAACEERLRGRYEAQRASGAVVEWWTPDQVRAHVPTLACDDVVGAIFGPEDGYLDPRAVLRGFRALAEHAGAEFREVEADRIDRNSDSVAGVHWRAHGRGGFVAASTVVNAAGPYAGDVGRAAGIDVPVEPVRQQLFRLELSEPLPIRIPMIFDPDGTHWRADDARTPDDPDGLIIGRSKHDEPVGENFEHDDARLHDEMLPALMRRHPAIRVARVADGWAGLYEMTPDHNALLGEHPSLRGFVIAAGFSGHGLMMAPATGVVVAELIAGRQPAKFAINPLAPDRFDRNQPFRDEALV